VSELGRLFGLALTFAPGDAERREIERLLAGVDPVQRRIATPEEAAPEMATVPPVKDAPTAPARPGVDFDDVGTRSSGNVISPRRLWGPQLRVRSWLAVAAALTITLALGAKVVRARAGGVGRILADSLFVVERGSERAPVARVITGRIDDAAQPVPGGHVRRFLAPPWVDSFALPFINPLPSPDGRFVAVERLSTTGTVVLIISADRRDTTRLTAGVGQNIGLGWSPDSRFFLVGRARTLADGSFDSDLFAYPLFGDGVPVPIDSAADRSVTEAAWSPAGTHVAWVARVGSERQQEVFVARPDGSERRNVSDNPAEDYHIAWAPDGTLIGFTSERSGNANLYALDISDWHLWRLTETTAHDDRVTFSPDGRYAAFESTRGGSSGIYVMPALGGSATRLTGGEANGGPQYSLAGWRPGEPGTYVDRIRILGPSAAGLRDSASWSVLAFDNRGKALPWRDAVWRLAAVNDASSPASIMRVTTAPDSVRGSRYAGVVVGSGIVRIIATVPGWRADTLFVRCGVADYAVLEDSFVRAIDPGTWLSFGAPPPVVAPRGQPAGLYPNGDFEWESGVLSRRAFDLRENLAIEATMRARFAEPPTAVTSMRMAVVAPADLASLDRTAPQLIDLVSVTWSGESRRITYTVDREAWSEPAAALGNASAHRFRIAVERGGRIAFSADGRLRWRSSLLLPVGASESRAQLWLAGRATGFSAAFSDVRVALERTNP
jgi:hypothetical protein